MIDLVESEIMSVDIAPYATFSQQLHIIFTSQQSHIIDLWYTWSKELDCPCQ